MLGRAITPLLRPRRFPPAVRLPPFSQSRCYARDRNSKPINDYKLPATAARPAWQQAPQKQGVVPNPVSNDLHTPGPQQSNASESSDLQPEFEAPANTQRNGSEHSDELRFRSRENKVDQGAPPSANRPQKDAQPEFGASANTGRDGSAESRRAEMADEILGSSLPGDEPSVRDDPTTTPQQPLPDLTQGIPSTLDGELREARSRRTASTSSLNITEDPSEPTPSSGGRGAEGLPRSAYISSHEKKKNNIFRYVYLMTFGGLIGYTVYLGRDWESEEEAHKHPQAPSGWGVVLFYNRVKARLSATLDYYNEPAFPTLLPKHDPNIQPPMCLVLSLEDLLVHQEWTRERGWRIAKRPGVDYFLRYLSQYYELVLFTTQPSSMADQVIRKLDPYRIIQWPLFREATLYKDGGYVKDLSYLNRDLSKVMLIDTDPGHARNQPANAIILPRWTGDPSDQTLVQLIPFLEYVATMGFDDTRAVLQSFEGKFIPAEFARREKLLREKFETKLQEERAKRPKRTVGGIGSLFGVKNPPSPDGLENTADALEQGKMLWDQIRERGQKQYELIDKQIREEGQKWLDDMAAEEKKFQDEQMNNMKSGFFGWMATPLSPKGGEEEKTTTTTTTKK